MVTAPVCVFLQWPGNTQTPDGAGAEVAARHEGMRERHLQGRHVASNPYLESLCKALLGAGPGQGPSQLLLGVLGTSPSSSSSSYACSPVGKEEASNQLLQLR